MVSEKDSLMVIGRVQGPYGLKGWLRIAAYGDEPEEWVGMRCWWLGDPQSMVTERGLVAEPEKWRPMELMKGHPCPSKEKELRILLAGVEDRNQASDLRGNLVAAPLQSLPRREGEFFWGQLIGFTVINQQGQHLGNIRKMLQSSAHPVLVVEDDGQQTRRIPWVAEIVRGVRLSDGCVDVEWEQDWE